MIALGEDPADRCRSQSAREFDANRAAHGGMIRIRQQYAKSSPGLIHDANRVHGIAEGIAQNRGGVGTFRRSSLEFAALAIHRSAQRAIRR